MEELAVPQHISRIGVYTGQSYLILFFTSIYYGFPYYFSVSIFFTYITTILHWHKQYKSGIIKTIDIISIINMVPTFYYNGLYMFCQKCQKAWIITIALIGIIYGINISIFYFQTNMIRGSYIMKPGSYSYFSLAYTCENTRERELCNYYNCYVHCIFLHVVASAVSFYCATRIPDDRR